MSIGENIKKFRSERNLTQKVLAKELGKSERMIQKYENNSITPSVDVLNQMSKILSVNRDDLMQEKELSVGERIKKYRIKLGLTQKQLADIVNNENIIDEKVSRVSITRYENNERQPNIKTLNEISKALNISLNDLTGSTNNYKVKELKDYTTEELLAEIKRRIEGVKK